MASGTRNLRKLRHCTQLQSVLKWQVFRVFLSDEFQNCVKVIK